MPDCPGKGEKMKPVKADFLFFGIILISAVKFTLFENYAVALIELILYFVLEHIDCAFDYIYYLMAVYYSRRVYPLLVF